ncbi:MAG TPA: restriction endonuclease subunit S [Bacteroidetes bacterium]|nr:restriction endonuclease subunit S [Bacteroidota bacterium]HIL56321.1 restriction endonuclease subunit S [Rhodothermales bacterium]
MRRYPDYKDSGLDWIGEIPEHWDTLKVKYAADLTNEEADGDRVAFQVALENIESKTGRYVATDGTYAGTGSGFRAGDVLFNKLRPYLAKVYEADRDGVSVGELLVLRPQDGVDSRFLFYRMLSADFISVVDGSTYGAKMPRANWDFVGNLGIPLPPLDEQRQLAAYLDRKTAEVDALIAKKRALITRLGELRAALVHRAVTKGLDPDAPMKDSGVEWLGEVPEHWTMTKLKYELDEIGTGGTPSTSNEAYWADEGGTPWVAISDISAQTVITRTAKCVTDAGLKAGRLEVLPAGTLLISIFASLGKTSVLGVDAAINQAILGLVPSASLNRDFLKLYLVALEPFIGYYSSSNTQENLNLTKVKNLDLPLPTLEEQERIVSHLQERGRAIDEIEERERRLIQRLEELRTSLISEVVTGKVDIRSEPLAEAAASAEPAAA